jgi:hypothetical protein
MPKPVIISSAIPGSIHVAASADHAGAVILLLLDYDVAAPAQPRERLALKGAAVTRFSSDTRTPR